jgi:hypothetical protein
MGHRAQPPVGRAHERPDAQPVARRAGTPAARVLELQRAAGNRAVGRVLARDKAPPTFRLLIADEGRHGLSESIVNDALPGIRDELTRITKDSSVDAVKAGIDVRYVKAAPERNDDFTRSLGRTTFLIFLTSGQDPKHAIEVMWNYIPMDEENRKAAEQKFKKSLASEGGVDLGLTPDRRRRSQSIGFVSSEAPLKELKKSGGGAASASAVLADVILHELGHALGHNKSLASIDHEQSGIMTAQLVLGSSGAHQLRKFSNASAKIIRDRLEELAGKLARK